MSASKCQHQSCNPHVNCFIEVNGTAPTNNTRGARCQDERQASGNKVILKMLYCCPKLSQLNSTGSHGIPDPHLLRKPKNTPLSKTM